MEWRLNGAVNRRRSARFDKISHVCIISWNKATLNDAGVLGGLVRNYHLSNFPVINASQPAICIV